MILISNNAFATSCIEEFKACFNRTIPVCDEQITGTDAHADKAKALCTLGTSAFCYSYAERAIGKEECDKELQPRKGDENAKTPNRPDVNI